MFPLDKCYKIRNPNPHRMQQKKFNTFISNTHSLKNRLRLLPLTVYDSPFIQQFNSKIQKVNLRPATANFRTCPAFRFSALIVIPLSLTAKYFPPLNYSHLLPTNQFSFATTIFSIPSNFLNSPQILRNSYTQTLNYSFRKPPITIF